MEEFWGHDRNLDLATTQFCMFAKICSFSIPMIIYYLFMIFFTSSIPLESKAYTNWFW